MLALPYPLTPYGQWRKNQSLYVILNFGRIIRLIIYALQSPVTECFEVHRYFYNTIADSLRFIIGAPAVFSFPLPTCSHLAVNSYSLSPSIILFREKRTGKEVLSCPERRVAPGQWNAFFLSIFLYHAFLPRIQPRIEKCSGALSIRRAAHKFSHGEIVLISLYNKAI